VKQQLAKIAAEGWQVAAEDIVFKDRQVFVKGKPELTMPFDKLAKTASYSGSGAVIIGRGYSDYGIDVLDFEKGSGMPGTSFSFTSQLTDVDVDLETGFVKCKEMIIAHDCGIPLNPINVEAQNQGGAVQGMGQVMYEQFVMQQGQTMNPSMADYKMPLAMDIPNIQVIDIITDDPTGPYGAKEGSEGSHVSAPPSIACAIHDATGIWFKQQPITPEKIALALKSKKENR
jgi:CO/xanthine dehydrogenase Mo-binding subunit